jgi:nucleoside 2-deoxyribosyltransferase
MSDDIWDDPEVQRYLQHARETLQPMIDQSTIVMSIAPSGDPDPKICMETGYMMWLDKPMIVFAEPGQKIPRNIRKVAAEIIYDSPDSPVARRKLSAALQRLGLGDARS